MRKRCDEEEGFGRLEASRDKIMHFRTVIGGSVVGAREFRKVSPRKQAALSNRVGEQDRKKEKRGEELGQILMLLSLAAVIICERAN